MKTRLIAAALLALALAGCIVVPAHTVHVPAVVVY